MAMLRAGAYSKKFQSLEKERLRQLKEQEKANRGKAHLYSKQTALRQKALEEKKRAMVIAEEDRRRKALEERRVAQKEATERFRSALGRVKSSAKNHRNNVKKTDQTAIDFYLPDKPKPKRPPIQPKKSIEESAKERVAFGKDVEIKYKQINGYHPPRQANGLQQRTPSLDDVLGQIRGERAATQEPPTNHGRVLVHKRVPDIFPQQVSVMGKRSSSDPNLNHNKLSPSNDIHTLIKSSDGSLPSQDTSCLHRNMSDESIVFKTVHQCSSKMDDDLRVTSPDTPISLSNESLLSSTVDAPRSSDIKDSLDTTRQRAVFTVGEDPETRDDSKPLSDLTLHAADKSDPVSQRVTHSEAQIPEQQQPIYACESDDLSSIDSLEDVRTSKQTNSSSARNCQTHTTTALPISRIAEQLREAELLKETQEKPKVVGILKKSSSNASMRNTTETESTKAKRVRFADNVRKFSTEAPQTQSSSTIDSARIELWKKVLPNGVTTHYVPNSAFTPKMRVSLTSKSSQPVASSPVNGLTVHIPAPSTENSPSSPRLESTSKVEPPKEATSNPPKVSSKEVPLTPPKVSTASVGLNGVTPNPPSHDTPLETTQSLDNDISKQISLEKTPTDEEITKLWDQIRTALEDKQKVVVPSQVFNFRVDSGSQLRHPAEISVANQTTAITHDQRGHHPPPQNPRKVTSAERLHSKPNDAPSQKGLIHRQTNLSRPIRQQVNLSPHPPAQLLARRGHSHTTTYPAANRQDLLSETQPIMHTTTTEPDLAVRTNGRKAPTALSVEERRLMLSIENLNHKIKDHMAKHPSVAKFQTPVSPEPPDFTPEFYPHPPSSPLPPQMHRVTSTHPHSYMQSSEHLYNLPKSRTIRRKSKTISTPQSITSEYARTYSRAPTHRPMFYNT